MEEKAQADGSKLERRGGYLCSAYSALRLSWATSLGLRPRLVYYALSARYEIVGLGKISGGAFVAGQIPSSGGVYGGLRRDRKAAAAYAVFSPSCQREYAEWIAEAKRPETRDRRIAQAVEWIAEGKQRNWKYQEC